MASTGDVRVYASFADQGGPTRRGPAQSGAFPRFFALSAETGAGALIVSKAAAFKLPTTLGLL